MSPLLEGIVLSVFKNKMQVGDFVCCSLELRVHFHPPGLTQIALTHTDGVAGFNLFLSASHGRSMSPLVRTAASTERQGGDEAYVENEENGAKSLHRCGCS